jgi:hypothetical protein
MNLKIQKVVTILLASTILISPLMLIAPSYAQATQILFYGPNGIANEIIDVYDAGPGNEFTVALAVEDVAYLYGLDIQIQWDTSLLQYVSHTLTVPASSFPSVPPSPWGGILNPPIFPLADNVNNTLGTYWVSQATLGGPHFTGDGAVFNMTFMPINVPFGDPLLHFNTTIDIISSDLPDINATAIPHDALNCTVSIHYKEFSYPEWPLLRVLDNKDGDTIIQCEGIGKNVTADVVLMAKNMTTGAYAPLDGFWDVQGISAILHYDPLMLSFEEMTVDPDGWFASFWTGGIIILNVTHTPGEVHFNFVGLDLFGTLHTPVVGSGRVLEVIFESLTESPDFPPGESLLCLRNPQMKNLAYNFDSIGGTIDLTAPVGSTFHEITPNHCVGPYQMTSWTDDDGDGELSEGDHLMLEDGAGFYFNYFMIDDPYCTLNLTLMKSLDNYLWPATFPSSGLANNGLPGRTVGTPPPNPYDGHGGPWYGNFSTTYSIQSVNSFNVTHFPFTGAEYTAPMVYGVDYVVHDAENTIELLHTMDTEIINEHWVDGVNNSLSGWPWINYVASGISSVYVKFPNGTERYAQDGLPYQDPPSYGTEYWYDPDWPWELEGWWALGYYCPAAYCWPAGTEWWINYTATVYFDIDYNTDPLPTFVEYDGPYADCLAITDANGTHWNEVYPISWQEYDVVYHDDVDSSTSITPGDWLWMSDLKQFIVGGVSTDLYARQKAWISEVDPDPIVDPFFGVEPIVAISGNPHNDRDYSPWWSHNYSPFLPHDTECATYVECFKPTGGFIDIYTQYPDPYGGQGWNEPSSMFWPQKNVHLCANVTYGGWPEQNKDVAFQVIDPHGVTWGIWYGRTNEVGVTCVTVTMPWPCDNPEYWFGEWCVIATVDVACVIVNDTLCFKYDYRVHITDVELDKTEYKHCEFIEIRVWWLTRSTEMFNITFTVTAVDASGVPFGFDYITVTIGGAQYCSYVDGFVDLTVHVEKWARPPQGTIYVGALSGFPHDGGAPETPVYTISFEILPEWA